MRADLKRSALFRAPVFRVLKLHTLVAAERRHVIARTSGEIASNVASSLEKELAEMSVPLSYMEEFYNLHLHVDHVRQRLLSQSASGSATDTEYVREAA